MSSLSPQPYKGTRDYYPTDKRIQNYIFNVWHQVSELYGYEEYGAPILELLDVYAAKSGQDLVNDETYSFTDRGGRLVAIRPEMTPSISRMVAAKRQELGYPARLYSIANFMRYERPQRGREREFWQLNADIFGVDGPRPESEIIALVNDMMKTFGATDEMYEIRVNNRKLIDAIMTSYLGLDTVGAQLMVKLFDKKSKISHEDFRDKAIDIFGAEQAPDGLKKISKLLSMTSVKDLPQEIREDDATKELQALFELLGEAGITSARFDVTLMRGLDYYTGTVFEMFDLHPENNRSMFGGGRYDGLVGLFGVDPIPTVGVAPGYTTVELFLRSHDLLPDFPSSTEVGIVVLGGADSGALELAKGLRREGVKTEVDITSRKIDKQIKSILKKKIPFMVFVGEDEVDSEIYPFKDTGLAEEQKLSFERIVSVVKDRRRSNVGEFDDLFE
ncbi:MAG: histidine--tRNA ligase [bacterium]|nr:histidine--tRNA ligase [bacterium]